MEKTEGKKTVIVIDEQGNRYESTYPKRAKGLVKSGRARYVDENTILLLACPLKIEKTEENKMNNNEIKNDAAKKQTAITLTDIIKKIDDIIDMNKELINNPGLASMGSSPGSENPIAPICQTNNKMIEFLKEIYFSIYPKPKTQDDMIIDGYLKILDKIIGTGGGEDFESIVETLTKAISDIKKSSK